MIDKLTYANAADFKQRYCRSFGFLINEEDKTRRLVYIKEVSSRMAKFSCLDGEDFFVNADNGVEFEFLPITRGWFSTKSGPVLLQRVPARQYVRGISENNTSAYKLRSSGELYAVRPDLEILADVFVTKPPLNPEHGVLINKFFLLSNGRVYFYNQIVGTYKNNKIALTEATISQELSDFILRQNLPYTVSVE